MKHLLPLLVLLPLIAVSQEYTYTNYDTKDGLAGSTVYCTVQDKEGFIWFGTETGLSRFDGAHFKNFTTADGLPDNEILRLFADSRNRVWIIPFKNSPCYYSKGKIYSKDNDSTLRKITPNEDLRSIAEDKYGNILIRKEFSYVMIRPDGSVYDMKYIDGYWFQSLDLSINEKGTFTLIVGLSAFGVTYYELDNGRLERLVRNDLYRQPFKDNRWCSVYEGLEVIRTLDSLVFFDLKRNKISRMPLPANFINMSPLNDSLFVINTTGKSVIYNFNQEKTTQEFLNGHEVTTVIEDREKNLWFTTLGEGVFRMGSTAFRSINLTEGDSKLSVFSVFKSDSLLFMGTDHLLLWSYNTITGKIKKYPITHGHNHGRIMSLMMQKGKKPDGFPLVGTDVGVFNPPVTERSYDYNGAVKSLVYDKQDLIIAAADGVYRMGGNAKMYNDSFLIWRNRATCAFPSQRGIYTGTLSGLYEIIIPRKPVYLGKDDKLLQGRISAITRSADDTYWIATYGNGIVGFKNGKVIRHFSETEGLSSNICRNIFVSANNLWVGTDKGLNRISMNSSEPRITTFSTADGLSSDIINSVFVDGNIVYVATPKGLTYFDDRAISRNSDCVLRITAISSSGTVWNYDTTGFVLHHKNNNIRFEFAGLSYKSAGDIVYRYRLMGLDTNWKSTKETFLSYPSLPSGDYKLQLVAVNKFGFQSDSRQISFSIEELLVEKTWFRILFLILAACLTWLAVWLYIKGIRNKETRKANTLKKMAELEQMALKAQMNPHFIFNSLNSIQQYVMDKDMVGANTFITDFSSLMRQTLEFSSKQDITLQEELQYIGTYLELERVRMEDKFVYEINVTEQAAEGGYSIPPMILQPFVENSIRHGIGYRKDKKGKITVCVSLKSGKLVCIIQDNGVGRKIAGRFKKNDSIRRPSRGMALTADRIEMFNKNNREKIEMGIDDLEDENGNASGTRVTISFPV